MKILTDILRGIKTDLIIGSQNLEIEEIQFDSRRVGKNCLFVAICGMQSDGHNYIRNAIDNGAIAIIAEKHPEAIVENITYVILQDSNEALALAAANFFEHPSSKIKLVGVTGTNGKTTTATLLYKLFEKLGCKSGLLSTVCNFVHTNEINATHTTPDSLQIQYLLNEMVKQGCEYCFMEVSSHSIVQKRIVGLNFSGGVFTNLTHDHLDYHHTFAEYLKAKKTFFDNLSKNAFALYNADDKNGKVMVQNTKALTQNYAIKSYADYRCKIIESHFDGMLLNFDNLEVWTHFIGTFNAYNLLAVYATALQLNQTKNEVLTILSELFPVSGRFDTIRINGITAIVDYAHTPDALENVLNTINEIRVTGEKIITVVGAGGNRDKTKRPVMARITAALSDKVILTSDNPRNENASEIIDEMYAGIAPIDQRKVLKIVDRREAIKTACMFANHGDIILIAGKGHEKYQEIDGVKIPFDDKDVAHAQLAMLNN